MATLNSATTYYEGRNGPMGLEYDLACLFARYLGVRLEIVVPDRLGQLLPLIERSEADIAAGLPVTAKRQRRVRFGPVYQTVTQQVVYRAGRRQPRGVEHLVDVGIEVVAGSAHAERLLRLRHAGHPRLSWTDHADLSTAQLLELVAEGLIDFTVANSNEVAVTRRFYPELRVAFDLDEPTSLAWALPRDGDDSLLREVTRFFEDLAEDGRLEQLLDRYYGHIASFDYVQTRTFRRHVLTRLPRFRAYFEEAAVETGVDWRLLAAMGYQESRWDPAAVSPTGVRGIMMLTQATARQVGVADRTDPWLSIMGGADYLVWLKGRIPERVREPDRTWFALASYNVGFGHLEDARILAEAAGKDPDKWVDVAKTLPLLSQERWHRQTRYGYARGREPVRFVERVRRFYDLLLWHFAEDPVKPLPRAQALEIDSPVL